MDALSLFLGLLVAGLCVLVVAWPFIHLTKRPAAVLEQSPGTDMEVLVEQRTVIYDAIRDLDFDYETGKLTEDDYRQQREVWVQRGVDVLKAIDTLQQKTGEIYPVEGELPADTGAGSLDLDAQIEAAVKQRRQSMAISSHDEQL